MEKTHRFGNYILLEIAAQCYIIKKDALFEDSLFHSLKGTYKFIAVMYSAGRNTMQIIEYEIEYSK